MTEFPGSEMHQEKWQLNYIPLTPLPPPIAAAVDWEISEYNAAWFYHIVHHILVIMILFSQKKSFFSMDMLVKHFYLNYRCKVTPVTSVQNKSIQLWSQNVRYKPNLSLITHAFLVKEEKKHARCKFTIAATTHAHASMSAHTHTSQTQNLDGNIQPNR